MLEARCWEQRPWLGNLAEVFRLEYSQKLNYRPYCSGDSAAGFHLLCRYGASLGLPDALQCAQWLSAEGASHLEKWKYDSGNQKVLKQNQPVEDSGQHLLALKSCGEHQSSSQCTKVSLAETFTVSDAETRRPFPVTVPLSWDAFQLHGSAHICCRGGEDREFIKAPCELQRLVLSTPVLPNPHSHCAFFKYI